MLLGACLGGVALLGTWGSLQWATPWADELADGMPQAKAYTQISSAIGAIIGTILAALMGDWFGRRVTYFMLCVASLASAAVLFQLNTAYNAMFLASVFVAGMCTASFYGWLPLYLPELFRTSVRATGQGFSYNFGRILAAVGSLQTGYLMSNYFGNSFPKACSVTSLIYVVGMVVIWFAPETPRQAIARLNLPSAFYSRVVRRGGLPAGAACGPAPGRSPASMRRWIARRCGEAGRSSSSVSSFRFREIHVNSAGSMIIDVNMQQLTPSVSTRPRLCKPRWLAIISEPKPTTVVSRRPSPPRPSPATCDKGPRCSRIFVDEVHAVVDADAQHQRQGDHVGRIERNVQECPSGRRSAARPAPAAAPPARRIARCGSRTRSTTMMTSSA